MVAQVRPGSKRCAPTDRAVEDSNVSLVTLGNRPNRTAFELSKPLTAVLGSAWKR
jgi:hypothetical protein